MIARSSFLFLWVGGALAQAPQDQSKPSPEALEFFEKKIRPVLADRCYSCHSAEAKKLKGALRLDSREFILRGGDAGPAIVPGDPTKSLLIKAVRYGDPDLKMPPKERLPAAISDDLARWVALGAPWPAGDAAKPIAPKGMEITAADREYWAYRPLKRPGLPRVKDSAWVRQPVDAFLLERLEAKGLAPAPAATRQVLIRRATYDLIGLPPAPEEVEAFVNDPASDAYERLLDRLLASPQYGEKWGRHWLDLVRFAETNGYERDGDKPNAWRYRDYVIRSFNEDKPFDRFLKEQLAGDEMEPRTPDALIATGYYRLGIVDDEPADRDLARYDGLDSILSTTTQAMLGTTLGCARCHDHKKDPIPQEDYYRMLAFIHGVNPLDRDGPGAEAVLIRDEEGHRVFEERMKALQEEEARLRKEKGPADRQAAVKKEIEELKKHPPKDQKTLAVSEPLKGEDTFLLRRGNPKVPGERVTPGFLKVLGFPDPSFPPPSRGRVTTGRRTVLAEWIASPGNPLTPRVLANRLWQHHFGRGIVPTPNDFGKLGDPPTHPELLDWLASEVLARGWKLKELHRMLMTSAAYRMASKTDPATFSKDPSNDLFSRFGMRRLTAEELRDSILAANGTLNLKMGGPSVFVPLPREVLETSSTPKSVWGTSTPGEAARRSVYIKVKRSLLVPLLAAHDFADTDSSCALRFATTVPTQALTLMNSVFMNEQAAIFARRLEKEAPGDVAAQVRRGLRAVTQRAPTPGEIRRGTALVDDLKKEGLDAGRALASFCLMALNLNEFVYLD
jgi:hypothetical protein